VVKQGEEHEVRVSGVILAGGRGRRMGGADKGWIELDGKPLVRRVLDRFAPQVDEVLISANRNLERYAALGARVIQDALPHFAGPLAGLHAASTAARFDLVATVPCDSPLLPLDLVARLAEALAKSNADVAVVRASGRIHPVFLLCRKHVLGRLHNDIAAGGKRLQEWVQRTSHVVVDFEDERAFCNVNEPADLAKLMRPH